MFSGFPFVSSPATAQDMCFAKPIGLFALLDEESRFPRASDETLGRISPPRWLTRGQNGALERCAIPVHQ